MRTPFVAGNWKLNKTPDEAEMLARCVVDAVSRLEGCGCGNMSAFYGVGTGFKCGVLHWRRAGCSEYVLGG